MIKDLLYQIELPEKSLMDFVDSFWMLHNPTDKDIDVIGLPDGRIDLFFSQTGNEPLSVTLLGIGTQSDQASIVAQNKTFAISFKLLASECILNQSIADILNTAKEMPNDFWGFNIDDLNDFALFHQKASQKIISLLPDKIDERKQKLFELIYSSKGKMGVQELSDAVGWSSRQINRYFTSQFGLPLKAFTNVLRFRTSLDYIAKGELFPELNFTDQNHFIKEIKKFSGVIPKELFKNQNDRFILLSAIRQM